MGASTSRQQLLQRMSLHEKAAQLVMPRIGGEYLAVGTPAYQRLRGWVADTAVGGVIITMGAPFETAVKLNMLQQLAAAPLLVAADMEHGPGQVLTGGVILPYGFENGGATRFPPLMGLGATGDEAFAWELGRITALEARSAGVHIAFAPVVDVNSNPLNPIINTRSFGSDPLQVGRMAAAHVRGLQDHGMLAAAKHFPGHGDTAIDSHVDLPVIGADRARLDALELVPFRAVIDAGIAGVMAGHIAFPALTGDSTPATLNGGLIQGVLRRDLGFDGLVFTDALDMGAIVRRYGNIEAALLALEAGVDILVQPPPDDVAAVVQAIVTAVRAGRIDEARLDASVERVLHAKQRLGLYENAVVDLATIPQVIGCPAHTATAAIAAQHSITLVRNGTVTGAGAGSGNGTLPLSGGTVLSIIYSDDYDPFTGRAFQRELASLPGTVLAEWLDGRADSVQLDRLMERARGVNTVIFAPFIRVVPGKPALSVAGPVAAAVRAIAAERPLIIVSFGSPYLLDLFADASAFVFAWGAWEPLQTAAARAITGRSAIGGRLPIPLPPHHALGDGVSLEAAERRP
jgi:beta-N-acetylhexosaminidase